MVEHHKNEYDAIIIGAGIGGLVCGCYLAKAGLKTLIVEMNATSGGYCTSFMRKGYRFDTSVHYIGGIKHGSLAGILFDLDLEKELKFNQFDPTDKVVLSNSVTYIRANPYDTINEFKKSFPKEKVCIENFFKFIMSSNIFTLYRKLINLTFGDFLKLFFNNKDLNSTFDILLLGNMGLPANMISAFASAIFIREFLLDPGYYPIGGMQKFSEYLSESFKLNGGKFTYSNSVKKIIVNNSIAEGVILSSGEKVRAKFIISGIDATTTFKTLIETKTKESIIIDKLKPSNSIFTVYIGIKSTLREITKETCNIWVVAIDDLESYYNSLRNNIYNQNPSLAMISFPSSHDLILTNSLNKNTIQIYTMATYESKNFWEENRYLFADKLLSLVNNVVPTIRNRIDFQITATPYTYFKFTSNRDGAAFGWASTINQTGTNLLPQNSSIKNLFLVGHWCTMGTGQGGISTVAISGKKVAGRIINFAQKK